MIWARLVLCAAFMFAKCAVLILVIVSMIEVFKTLSGIVRDLEKDNEILLVVALGAALVPSGAMMFWVCNAITFQLDLPIRRVWRYFRNQRDKKTFAHGHARAGDQGKI
jgi:hypothetical protein